MMSRYLQAIWCVGVGLGLAWPVQSQAAEESILSDDAAFWSKTINVRSWFGYKDNVLLANEQVIGSPFVAGGAEFMLLRFPITSPWEYLFFASVDYQHYLDANEVDREVMVIGQTHLKRNFAGDWQAGLTGTYFYFDQVFDYSVFDREFATLQVQGHNFTLTPSLRKEWKPRYWAELEMIIERQAFEAFIDDHWEIGPRLTLGRNYGHRSSASFNYEFGRRLHDERVPRDALGRIIPGETLEFSQHEFVVRLSHNWDERRRWRTLTKAGVALNTDNASGYYDYVKPYLSQQVRYQAKSWAIKTEAQVADYDYEVQPISETDLTRRKRTLFLWNLRAEKNLGESFKLFAQFEHERVISNLALDRYRVNTVFGGIDWEF